MKKTIIDCARYDCAPFDVSMTDQDQVFVRETEEKASKMQAEQKRMKALAQRWPDPFDLLDDILDRGAEKVKAERDRIKSENPKNADK